MISLDDILDMCSLTRDEIAVLAAHEHIADVNAAALAEYEMHRPHGPQHVQQVICDDIRAALHGDDLTRARALFTVLRHYLAEHPEAARGAER